MPLPITIRYPRTSSNFWSVFVSTLQAGSFDYSVIDASGSRWPADESDIVDWLYRAEMGSARVTPFPDSPTITYDNPVLTDDIASVTASGYPDGASTGGWQTRPDASTEWEYMNVDSSFTLQRPFSGWGDVDTQYRVGWWNAQSLSTVFDDNFAISANDANLRLQLFDFFLTVGEDFEFLTINDVDFNPAIRDSLRVTAVTSTGVTLFSGIYPANRNLVLDDASARAFVNFVQAPSGTYIDVTFEEFRTNLNGGIGSLAVGGDAIVTAAIPVPPVRVSGIGELSVSADSTIAVLNSVINVAGRARVYELQQVLPPRNVGFVTIEWGNRAAESSRGLVLTLFPNSMGGEIRIGTSFLPDYGARPPEDLRVEITDADGAVAYAFSGSALQRFNYPANQSLYEATFVFTSQEYNRLRGSGDTTQTIGNRGVNVYTPESAGFAIPSASVGADSELHIVPPEVYLSGIGSAAVSSDTELSVIPPAQIDIAGVLGSVLLTTDVLFLLRQEIANIGVQYRWGRAFSLQGIAYQANVTAIDNVLGRHTVSLSVSVAFPYTGYRIQVDGASGEVLLDEELPYSVDRSANNVVSVSRAELDALIGDTISNPGSRGVVIYFPQTAVIPTSALTADTELDVRTMTAAHPAGIGSLAVSSDTDLGVTPATAVRLAGIGSLAFGAGSQLQIDSSSAIRLHGIGSLAINLDTALDVVPPTAIRPAGIASLAVGGGSELYVDPASATRIRGVGSEAVDVDTELSVVEPAPARPAGIPSLAVSVGSQLRVLATTAIRLAGIGTAAFGADAVAQVIPPTTIAPSGIATAQVRADSALNVIRRVVPDSTTNFPLTIRHPLASTRFWSVTTGDLEAGEFSYAILDTSNPGWPADEDDIILWLFRSEISARVNRDDDNALENVSFSIALFDFFPTLTDFSFLSINNVDFASSIRDNLKFTVVTSTAVTLFEGDYPSSRAFTLVGTEATDFLTFAALEDTYIDITWSLKRTNVNGGFGSLAITGDSAVARVPPTPVRLRGFESLSVGASAELNITRPDDVRIGGATRRNLAMLTIPQTLAFRSAVEVLVGWEFRQNEGISIRAFSGSYDLLLIGINEYRENPATRFDIVHPTTGLVFDGLASDFSSTTSITEDQFNAIYGPSTDVNNLDDRVLTFYLPDTTETPSDAVVVDSVLDITATTPVRISGIGSVAVAGDSVLDISSILQILPVTVILPRSSANTWVSDPANTEQRLFAGAASNRAITVSRSARNLSVSITGNVDFSDEVEDEGVIFALYVGGRTLALFEDVTEDHPYTYRISIAERNALRDASNAENLLVMVFTRPEPIYVPEAIGEAELTGDTELVVNRVTPVSVSGIGTEAVSGENALRVFRVAGIRLGGIDSIAFSEDIAVQVLGPAPVRPSGIDVLGISVSTSNLRIDVPGSIRISGIGSLAFGGGPSITVLDASEARTAGIGSLAFAGDSALVVEESEIPIPEGITESSTGDITFGDYRLQWSQGFEETYRFRTGIITHRGGTEQRIAHRARPRVEYEFTAFLDPIEMRSFLARNSTDQGELTHFPHPRDVVPAPSEIGVGANFLNFDPAPGWLNAGSILFTKFGQHIIPGVALGVDAAGALIVFSNTSPLPAGTPIYRGAPIRPASSPSIAAATSRVGMMQVRADGDPVDNWLPTYPATAPGGTGRQGVFRPRSQLE